MGRLQYNRAGAGVPARFLAVSVEAAIRFLLQQFLKKRKMDGIKGGLEERCG